MGTIFLQETGIDKDNVCLINNLSYCHRMFSKHIVILLHTKLISCIWPFFTDHLIKLQSGGQTRHWILKSPVMCLLLHAEGSQNLGVLFVSVAASHAYNRALLQQMSSQFGGGGYGWYYPSITPLLVLNTPLPRSLQSGHFLNILRFIALY